MILNELTAVSPVDGRYRNKTDKFDVYFSEYALIKYRVLVEIEYFIALCNLPLPQLKGVSAEQISKMKKIYEDFSISDAERTKEIEKTTNHDVKSVEYFIKEKFDQIGGLEEYKEFIHFGLTSQDVNNTAVPLSFKEALEDVYFPLLENVISTLNNLAEQWKDIPMLARTHGQAASPTKLGKEINVFVNRLEEQKKLLDNIPYAAKFGGATGNFNAHLVAYPKVKWIDFANNFVNKTLGLSRSQITTQIEHYDHFAAHCDGLKRINTILIDLDRDMWTYISMDYFKQQIKAGEVGSSAMPHKVNPIDFENSEGNLGMANCIYEYLASKLPISRLQRDLTDSTVLRNIGMPLAHTLIGFSSLLRGLGKVIVNQDKINFDLDNTWSVVAEAVQTILRREAYPNPYEALKGLTRTNEKITKETFEQFINDLSVDDGVKEELRAITPFTYTGIY